LTFIAGSFKFPAAKHDSFYDFTNMMPSWPKGFESDEKKNLCRSRLRLSDHSCRGSGPECHRLFLVELEAGFMYADKLFL
jgi:hypothetical protein